ncbi:hypothetical protein PRBEI_2001718100 [Prionailurus iriomotensis]
MLIVFVKLRLEEHLQPDYLDLNVGIPPPGSAAGECAAELEHPSFDTASS